MSNFTIKFSNPWFLLLLIPAIGLALLPYFRMNKRYRRTRNRITSIVLHITVMVLSISVLAGITFEYDTPNKDNEVILLVDTSDSGKENADDKDDFVKSVIDNADSMFKLGIVKFGYDQVYAVELSEDTEEMYTKYLQAPAPDNTATDIAAALNFAANCFTKKESARIVLLSDALETDGKAINAVKTIAAQGIKVDTVSFPNEEVGDEVQIVSMEVPNEKIKLGEEFSVKATIQSSFSGKAFIKPFDKSTTGEASGAELEIELVKGVQTINVPYTLIVPGLHTLSMEIASEKDTLALNNSYTSYIDIQAFDKILIIESIDNESESIRGMLNPDLKVSVVNINDPLNRPETVNELRAYDQIILLNVAYKDMPVGFDDMLYSYVHDFGGGLFTICGNEEDLNPNDEEWKANAYTKEDMFGTTYQKLLPVEVINYTPPAAVVIIIDRSGSMYDGSGDYEKSKLYYAKEGAKACLDALTERDFVGIMSLGDDYEEEIDLTPRPNKAKIESAIERIEHGGNTLFYPALEQAGKILGAKTGVEKKHIIIVTDGEPTDGNDDYRQQVKLNAENGITMSIVGINCYGDSQRNMKDLLVNYGGMTEENFHAIVDPSKVPETMRKDLEVPEIKDVNYVPYKPTFGTTHIITSNIDEETMPMLNGFYGVKAKEGAEVVVMAQFTPLYAQWKVGLGTVGTFACDLNGTWSKDFINDPAGVGAVLINNIVEAIFPTQNVQPEEIDSVIEGDNFSTVISIFTDLEEGQYIELTVKSPAADGSGEETVQTIIGTASGYSRLTFAVKTPGLHEIVIDKKSEDGTVVATSTTYKALGYSKEYDLFRDTEAAGDAMIDFALYGKGEIIEEPWDVFENAVKYIHNVINPKILFSILALALFLLDIAARKFKWKWPHEIFGKKSKK